ncbi:MAG: PD-(D/E)XK nuclease family protein, partial [Mahellales bacterium]
MKAEVHIAPLFSNHRMELVDYCLQLQRRGMGFLYILPSRDSIFSVRNHILQTNRGMAQSSVIMFDDLERMITRDYIYTHRVLKPWASRILLKKAVAQAGNLKCYGGVRSKEGFIDDVASVIKSIKRRTCLGPKEFLSSIQTLKHKPSLYDKAYDLYLIYKTYQDRLHSLGLYDEDDLALKAVELAGTSNALHNIGAIIIDGFINVDRVDMGIIKSLKDNGNMDIICNIPFSTPFIDAFLSKNIVKDFKEAGFKIEEIKTGYRCGTKAERQLPGVKADCAREMDTRTEHNHPLSCGIRDLALNMFTGRWPAIQDHSYIKMLSYPSIESEVRQTARLIKERLMEGEKAEDIAIYINNLQEYYSYILGIFREFNIPIALAQTMTLGSAPLVVDIMDHLAETLDDGGTFEGFVAGAHLAIEHAAVRDNMLRRGDFKDDHGWQLFLREVRAYNGLLNVLRDLRLAYGALDMLQIESDKGTFLQHINDVVDRAQIIVEPSPYRGVAVLNTDRARGIHFNWVFILGANEGVIPKSHMNSGMFSAAEYNMLWDVGIALYNNRWELEREKIRFVLALASARKGVNISYTTSSGDGGYAIQSPFVDEVGVMVPSSAGPEVTLRDTMVVPLKEVMSPRELSVQTMLACWQGPWQTGALDQGIIHRLRDRLGPLAGLVDFPLKAGGVEFSRHWSAAFDRYDGIIGSDYLPQISGQYYFTASQVNTYFKCPFKYMMEYVFKMGTYEEDEEQYTNMDLGNIYHHLLEAYYRNIRDFDTPDEKLLKACMDKEFSRLRDIDQSDAVLQAIRQEVEDIIEAFIQHDLDRLKHYKDATDGERVLRPYLMEYKIADDNFHSDMAFKSRIDRIDLEYRTDTGRPTGRFIIYDYKKKNVHGLDDLLKSRDSQLPIYYNSLVDSLKKELGLSEVDCMGLMYLGVEESSSGHKVDGVIRREYKYELDQANKHYLLSGEVFDAVMDFCREMVIK